MELSTLLDSGVTCMRIGVLVAFSHMRACVRACVYRKKNIPKSQQGECSGMSQSPDLSPVQSCLDFKRAVHAWSSCKPTELQLVWEEKWRETESVRCGSLTEANLHRLGLHPLNADLRGGGGWRTLISHACFLINCHYLVKIFVF